MIVALAVACVAAPFFALKASGGEEPELVVYAATSLREVLQDIALTFEKLHPKLKVHFNFSGSQDLRVQIEQGAKVDVFASADWKHMKLLAGLGFAGEQRVIARNSPVLVMPKNNPAKVRSFADLPKATHWVVGASEVPIGAYTDAILAAAEKLYGKSFREQALAHVRSRELNVRQVLTKVAVGEADAGIVYKTDALTMSDKVEMIEIPKEINVVADYPVAVLKGAPHLEPARAFVKFILSKEGQKFLAAAGFGPGELQGTK
jgi:molybdate transport system substrate-binding protein